MPPHSRFLDKSFNKLNTRNYVMSALFDVSGFSISIYDPDKNKIIGLVTYHFEELNGAEEINAQLDHFLNTVSWLSFPFLKVCIVYRNNLNTLIPLPLFDKKNAALYLEFNHILQQENRIFYDFIKHTDAVNIYSLPMLLFEKVKTIWPNSLLKHASTILIENLHVLVKNKNDNNALFVNVTKNSFDVVYFKDNKLDFYNQFQFKTATDFIYFLLSAIEQLKLNPESVKLILLGNIDKGDAFYEIIYRYIRHISFIKRNDNYAYSYVLDEIKPQMHFLLFNSLQCE